MKQKKIVIETTYFGSIRRCLHLNKENNYTYINSELVSKDIMLLKTSDERFITGSDYINKKNKFLNTKPSTEGELYVDENSLLPVNEIEEAKIQKKSLHL